MFYQHKIKLVQTNKSHALNIITITFKPKKIFVHYNVGIDFHYPASPTL